MLTFWGTALVETLLPQFVAPTRVNNYVNTTGGIMIANPKNALCGLLLGAGVLAAATPASAAITELGKVAIERGNLVIEGKTSLAGQKVRLDGGVATTISDADKNFAFKLIYLPTDCVVKLGVGKIIRAAVVAGCGRGAADPQVVTVPDPDFNHPPIPAGLQIVCLRPECPVVKWNGITYWAFSYIDNRSSFAIVAYRDVDGSVAARTELAGARYIDRISVDAAKGEIAFVGQAGQRVLMFFASPFLQPK